MASNLTELSDLLGGFRDYLLKEYSLNTDARSYKGENASDETLPSDWVEKLKPLSGGTEGGHEGDNGPERKATSTASQGKDPYIHKQLTDLSEKIDVLSKQMAGMPMMMGDDEMSDGEEEGWEEYEDEGEEVGGDMDVVEDAEVEEDYSEKMNHYKEGDPAMMDDMGEEEGGDINESVLQSLNEIKALLSQNLMSKQQTMEVTAIDNKIGELQKSLSTAMSKQVENELAKHGLRKSVTDEPRRRPVQKKATRKTPTNVMKSQPNVVPDNSTAAVTMDTQYSSVFGDDANAIQKAFVTGVEELLSKHNSDDFSGTFRMLNNLRDQNGVPQMLDYINRSNVGGN